MKTVAEIAKERLLAVQAEDLAKTYVGDERLKVLREGDKDPKGEAMINGYGCTKEQYELWLTSPLEKQIALEMEWGFLWRDFYPSNALPEPVVAASVEATLAQRGSRYGDFTDHARICQDLMGVMRGAYTKEVGNPNFVDSWTRLDAVKQQALTVIADKIARILSGDPNYDDNWHDIQGYAKLVEDRLPCNVEKKRQEDFDKLSPQLQQSLRDSEQAVFFGDSKKKES